MKNDEILNKIRERFPKDHASKNYLKLPSGIKFTMQGVNDVEMIILDEAVLNNMQDDNAAFEGWALVLKRWCNFDRVFLGWKHQIIDRANPEFGHFQRFLFRVVNFSRDFASWFFISPDCLSFHPFLQVVDGKKYYLNRPLKDRCVKEPQGKEGILEYKYACKEWSVFLKNKTKADFLDRQLPVGVFKTPEDVLKKKVSVENAIFSRGKSAIDIWGTKGGDELLLFELKADGNRKMGIISELYFYCCVMQRVQKGSFLYENLDPPVDRITRTNKITAYFFAPALHPLIDENLVTILNKGVGPVVEFHHLAFPPEGGTKIDKVF